MKSTLVSLFCLSFSMLICLPIQPSYYLLTYDFAFIYSNIHLYPSLSMSFYLSIYMSVCLSVYINQSILSACLFNLR